MTKRQYRDFSKMPADVLQRFSKALDDIAKKAASKRKPALKTAKGKQ